MYRQVIQLHTDICVCMYMYFRFSSHIGYNRILSRDPWARVLYLLIIYFKYNSVCISCSVVSDSLQPLCRLPDSAAHGILQARILDWVAMPLSRGSS